MLSHNGRMEPQIAVRETDDPRFVELMNAVLKGTIDSSSPHEVWIVQIDNWFDQKWLRFSGKGVVDFPLAALGIGENGALYVFRQDELTFPTLHPRQGSKPVFLCASWRPV